MIYVVGGLAALPTANLGALTYEWLGIESWGEEWCLATEKRPEAAEIEQSPGIAAVDLCFRSNGSATETKH